MLQLYTKTDMVYGEMPLEVDDSQVIFFDNGVDHPLNHYVKENLPRLKKLFAYHGLQLCYISQTYCDTEDLDQQIRYRIPWMTDNELEYLDKIRSLAIEEMQSAIRAVEPQDGAFYLGNDEKVLMKVDVSKPDMYEVQFELIASEYGWKIGRRFERDEIEDRELRLLFKELVSKKPKGVVRKVLEDALDGEKVLSRVIIQKNGDVLLPEYNRTIHLYPKEKALFFLYLRHPEGIALMDLIDYKKEIAHIYKHFCNQSDPEIINATIEQFFNDFNDINVQRSRIKRAFLREFDDTLAEHYYITGKAGGTMRITIPRDMVEWQIQFL